MDWEDRLRKRLPRLDELGSRNAGFCRAFISYLLAQGYSYARADAYITTFLLFGRYVGKSFDQVSREDVEEFFEWMVRRGYKRETIAATKARLKRFYKWLLGDDERYPPQVAWLKSSRVERMRELPKEILSPEEVNAMANAADNIKQKALVLVLYESGLRAGELISLKLRDVAIDKYGAILHVRGKTGDRKVRVISSAPALLEWMNHHPRKNDPNAYLFCRDRNQAMIGYNGLKKILTTLAKKAGIRKRVYPHLFRHSRATELAKYLTESQLATYFGWSQGSKMPKIYVHLSGRDLDPALLRLAGLQTEAEEAEGAGFKPRPCPRCGELNPPNERTCKRCGSPLDLKELIQASPEPEIKNKVKEMEEAIAELRKTQGEMAKLIRSITEKARGPGAVEAPTFSLVP